MSQRKPLERGSSAREHVKHRSQTSDWPLASVSRRMPAKSKRQQMAAGAALSAKRGEIPKSALKGASKSMAASMTEKELADLAHTQRKKLPTQKPTAAAEKRNAAK